MLVKKLVHILCILGAATFLMGTNCDADEFSVIIASDPQLWWNSQDGAGSLSDSEVEEYNKQHRRAMNDLIEGSGLPQGFTSPVAVIMNGDLTEYGRWDTWDAYEKIYKDNINVQIYNGLGNHDYENNSPNAGDSGCHAQATDIATYTAYCAAFDLFGTSQVWGQDACTVVDNMAQEGWEWCASDAKRRMEYWLETNTDLIEDFDSGSVAYSFEIGDIHFIQLHNYPTYSNSAIGISSSINWLKDDLKEATSRYKRIVINMHDMGTYPEFEDALLGYEDSILGIFSGHIHQYCGYANDIEVGGKSIPWFYSGSSTYNAFNLVSFDSNGMTVQPIDSNSGSPVYHTAKTTVSSDVGGNNLYLSAPQAWDVATVSTTEIDVAFKGEKYSKYVRAKSNGGSGVVADRTSVGSHETFTMIGLDSSGCIVDGDQVLIETGGGYYFKSYDNEKLKANTTQTGSTETFTLKNHTDSTGCLANNDIISLKTTQGKYIAAKSDGSCDADKDTISTKTKFKVKLQ